MTEINAEINADIIKEWATNPENKERAKALGSRLVKFAKDAKGLLAEPSLGEFEDRATRWAVNNQFEAKMLLFKLAKLLVD